MGPPESTLPPPSSPQSGLPCISRLPTQTCPHHRTQQTRGLPQRAKSTQHAAVTLQKAPQLLNQVQGPSGQGDSPLCRPKHGIAWLALGVAPPNGAGKGHALLSLPGTGSRGGRNVSEQNQEHQTHVWWQGLLWGSEVSAPHRGATAPEHHNCCHHILLGQKGPFPRAASLTSHLRTSTCRP